MRSPALISASSKAGCHAVLASLSGRYPPLEGRSPTCYSPVRHSTQGLLPFRVRLACVRHAASVDSEPGSNSQVKPSAPGLAPRSERLTRAPVDWLCVVVTSLSQNGPGTPCAGALRPRVTSAPAPLADTRRASRLRPHGPADADSLGLRRDRLMPLARGEPRSSSTNRVLARPI